MESSSIASRIGISKILALHCLQLRDCNWANNAPESFENSLQFWNLINSIWMISDASKFQLNMLSENLNISRHQKELEKFIIREVTHRSVNPHSEFHQLLILQSSWLLSHTLISCIDSINLQRSIGRNTNPRVARIDFIWVEHPLDVGLGIAFSLTLEHRSRSKHDFQIVWVLHYLWLLCKKRFEKRQKAVNF